MGRDGLRGVNDLSCSGAHYLRSELLKTELFAEPFTQERPFLKEFVLRPLVDIALLQQALLDAGFFGAVATEEGFVSFCVTEKHSKEECDSLVDVVKSLKK